MKNKIREKITNLAYVPNFQKECTNSVCHTVFAANTADCGPPPFLLNGALNYQNTMEGSEVHYHCRDGFTLEGRMTSVCEENGSWNPTPICTPQTGMHTTYYLTLQKHMSSQYHLWYLLTESNICMMYSYLSRQVMLLENLTRMTAMEYGVCTQILHQWCIPQAGISCIYGASTITAIAC